MGTSGGSGAINYTGTGDTCNRTIKIGNQASANTTANAVIQNNGANGGTGLKLTATSFATSGCLNSYYNRTLILGGANTDANEVSGSIGDNQPAGGTGLIGLTKADAGTWKVSGNNTFGGAVAINAGTFILGNANALGWESTPPARLMARRWAPLWISMGRPVSTSRSP